MKTAKIALNDDMLSRLEGEAQLLFRSVSGYLSELGYLPQRQKVRGFVLAYRNNALRQTIAKIGVRERSGAGAFFSLKFYACKSPPEKFAKAVRDAVLRSNGQYGCVDCGVCGAAEDVRGYRVVTADGAPFVRCGAYVVEIPGLTPADAEDVCRLLREQHAYFLHRGPIPGNIPGLDIIALYTRLLR